MLKHIKEFFWEATLIFSAAVIAVHYQLPSVVHMLSSYGLKEVHTQSYIERMWLP